MTVYVCVCLWHKWICVYVSCLNPNLAATYSMNSVACVIVNFILSQIIEPNQITKFYFSHAEREWAQHKNPIPNKRREIYIYLYIYEERPCYWMFYVCWVYIGILYFFFFFFHTYGCRFQMHKYFIFLSPYLFFSVTEYYATMDKRDGKRKIRFKPFSENRIATYWFFVRYCMHTRLNELPMKTHWEYAKQISGLSYDYFAYVPMKRQHRRHFVYLIVHMNASA